MIAPLVEALALAQMDQRNGWELRAPAAQTPSGPVVKCVICGYQATIMVAEDPWVALRGWLDVSENAHCKTGLA